MILIPPWFALIVYIVMMLIPPQFNEPSSELLQKLCCLDSKDSFSRFNVNKSLTIERFIMDIIIIKHEHI
jgi:hypothetical protein